MHRHHESRSAVPPARDTGFALIELLIVIAILGILSTIVVLSVRGITDRGAASACRADQHSLESAYESWVAKGAPAYNPASGTFESFLVTQGFLHGQSSRYDVASDGALSAQAGGGCPSATPAAFTDVQPGLPGLFLPGNSTPPAALAALVATNVAPSNPAAWVLGEYVVLGDGSFARWTGATWIARWQAVVRGVSPTPGTWLPAGVAPPDDLQMLLDSGFQPADPAAWTSGEFVILGDNSAAVWNGTSWYLT